MTEDEARLIAVGVIQEKGVGLDLRGHYPELRAAIQREVLAAFRAGEAEMRGRASEVADKAVGSSRREIAAAIRALKPSGE